MISKIGKNAVRVARHNRQRHYMHGTPERPRLNVYRSLKHIYAQVIDDVAGVTLAAASTVEAGIAAQLEGKNKKQAAEIVGETVAKRAKDKGVEKVVFAAELARRVARDGQDQVVGVHSAPIIDHADQFTATLLDHHVDSRRASIDGIFHQLLHDTSGTFDHFASGDFVDKIGRETLNSGHKNEKRKKDSKNGKTQSDPNIKRVLKRKR